MADRKYEPAKVINCEFSGGKVCESGIGEVMGPGGRVQLTSPMMPVRLAQALQGYIGQPAWAVLYEVLKNSIEIRCLRIINSQPFAGLVSEGGWNKRRQLEELMALIPAFGLGGEAEILSNSLPDGEAFFRVKKSTAALEYINELPESDRPVCVYLQGLFAGITSVLFNSDFECIEEKCTARGDGACEFHVFKSSRKFEFEFFAGKPSYM